MNLRPLRVAVLLAGTALIASGVVPLLQRALAADATPAVELQSASAKPRQVEEATHKAILRDYGKAWQTLVSALEQNNAGTLDAYFIGAARDRLAARINAQKNTGLRTRYIDRGHKLEAVFYSPEGSAMQLRDTAQLELQVLDGRTVIHSETISQPYLVLMTVAENRWKVRALESLPQK